VLAVARLEDAVLAVEHEEVEPLQREQLDEARVRIADEAAVHGLSGGKPLLGRVHLHRQVSQQAA